MHKSDLKMLKYSIVLLTFIAISQTNAQKLLNVTEYLRNVEQMIQSSVSNTTEVSVSDYSHHIKKTYFNYKIDGDMNYTNGHLDFSDSSLHLAFIATVNFNEKNGYAFIAFVFTVQRVNLYFDYEAEVERNGTRFSGTASLHIPHVQVFARVDKRYPEGTITSQLYTTNQTVIDDWTFYPTNPFLQNANTEMEYNVRTDIEGFLGKVFNRIGTQVVNFPDICFNCKYTPIP